MYTKAQSSTFSISSIRPSLSRGLPFAWPLSLSAASIRCQSFHDVGRRPRRWASIFTPSQPRPVLLSGACSKDVASVRFARSCTTVSAVVNASVIVEAITPVGPRFTQPAQYRPGRWDMRDPSGKPSGSPLFDKLVTRPYPSLGMTPRRVSKSIPRSFSPGRGRDL